MNSRIKTYCHTSNFSKSHLDRRVRGAASVEAVVALPFFVLIFISLFYLRDELVKKHELAMTARSCAWLYSQSNCQAVPLGCAGFVSNPSSSSGRESAELHDKLQQGLGETSGLAHVVAKIVNGLVDSVLDAAFGQSFEVEPKGSVARPALYGGGTASLSSQYHLACNLAERTPLDVVTGAWNYFKP
jgi:hypothetical protein